MKASLTLALVVILAAPLPALAKQSNAQAKQLQRLETGLENATARWVAGLNTEQRSQVQVAALEQNAMTLAYLTQLEERVQAGRLTERDATRLARTRMIKTYQKAVDRMIRAKRVSPQLGKELRAYPELRYGNRSFDQILDEILDLDEELNTSFAVVIYSAAVIVIGVLAIGSVLLKHWMTGDEEVKDDVISEDSPQVKPKTESKAKPKAESKVKPRSLSKATSAPSTKAK